MNVIFLSPHFPAHFYNFCRELKRQGVRVLGIGDAAYDTLGEEVRNNVSEYYYTPSLEDYDAVYRAVAFFIAKYGRIDRIESQNEYWLRLEARLREDFNIHSGYHPEELARLQRKSAMKAIYRSARVKTARWVLYGGDWTSLRRFAGEVGYPLFAKPDTGVGAAGSFLLRSPSDLEAFARREDASGYIVEEFVPGHVETFDGIVDGEGNIVFAAGQVMRVTPFAMLHGDGENISYTQDVWKAADLSAAGRATVEAAALRNCFFHCEFFRLDECKKGLGAKGGVLGLEINLRAPGGYIPDKMNYAFNVDVYRIWAETIATGRSTSFPRPAFASYVTHFARGAGIAYRRSLQEIRARFAGSRYLYDRTPPAKLSGGMGALAILLRAGSVAEIDEQANYIFEHA